MADYVSAYTGSQIDDLLSKVNPLEQSVSQKAPLAMLASSLGEGGGWSTFLDTSQNITDLISYLFGLIHTGSVRFIRYAPYFGFAWANGSSNSNSGFIFEANNKVVYYNTFTETQASLASGTDSQIFSRIIAGTPFTFAAYANTSLGNVTLTKSYGSSGYWKGPDGFMVCWGSFTGNNTAAGANVNFPTSFYVAPYSISFAVTNGTGSSVRAATCLGLYSSYFKQNCAWAASSSGYGGEVYYYTAFGRWK